jgi:hypothetical protein
MNLRLERRLYREDGIFSDLKDENGKVIAVTLEHSYDNTPKIPNGTFTCKRGQHRLHDMVSDFTTFEIENIPGHFNILFHWGNFNKDSDGCVLVGQSVAFVNGTKMITKSKDSFDRFMQLQNSLNSFQLTVVG